MTIFFSLHSQTTIKLIMKYPFFFFKLNLQKTYLPHNIKVISLEDAIYLVIHLSLKENTSFFGIQSRSRLN